MLIRPNTKLDPPGPLKHLCFALLSFATWLHCKNSGLAIKNANKIWIICDFFIVTQIAWIFTLIIRVWEGMLSLTTESTLAFALLLTVLSPKVSIIS